MRILLNKKESGIPSEYIEVEYLESTGTQWIDTGIVGNNTSRVVETEFKVISYAKQYQGIFGNYVSETTKSTRLSFIGGDRLSSWFCHIGSTATYNGFPAIIGSWVKLHLDNDKLLLNDDSITKSTTAQSGSNNTTSLALFSQHLGDTYASPVAFKYFKIWDNNTLVRDFIPCIRKIDQVAGMYDLVSKQFYTNQGTGSFIAGPVVKLPKGYDMVEYIESTGTQHIDTGVIPKISPKIECTYQVMDSLDRDIFGFTNSPQPLFVCDICENYGSKNTLFYKYGATQKQIVIGEPSTNQKHTLSFGSDCIMDGTTLVSGTSGNFSTNTKSIVLFKGRQSSSATVRFFGNLRIYDNNILVRNFVPAIRTSDNVAGLYDTIEDKFYVNQGSGTFKTGPYLALPEGYQELDYIESTGTQWINTELTGATHNAVFAKFSAQNPTATRNYVWGWGTTAGGRSQFSYSNPAFCGFGTNYTNSLSLNVDKNIHTIEMKDRKFTLDGNLIWTSNTNWFVSSQGFVALFACWLEAGGLQTMSNGLRIYEWKAWQDSALVRNFIPAIRQADEVLGMYDLVTKQFFTNRGTGTFKTGDIPKPPKTTTQRLIFSKQVKVLPDEYQQIEYLESTGTQYIDTGVLANGSFDADFKVNTLNAKSTVFAGARSTTQHLNFGQIDGNGTSGTFAYLNQYWSLGTGIWSPNTDHSVQVHVESGDQYIVINGTKFGQKNFTGVEQLDMNIHLFERNFHTAGADTLGKFAGRMYYFKIWNNNVLVRDFIPVIRKVDNVAGMYDVVEGKFYTNQGTDSFLTGPLLELPDDYQQIDYIGSTGTQFILTGYTPTINTDFEVKFGSTSPNTGCWVMGSPTWIGVHYKGTSVGVTNSSAEIAQQYTPYNHDDTPITLKLTGDTVYANGNQLGTIERRAGTLDFALFGYRDTNQGASIRYTGKIYSAKIWENGLLVRNFIPCIRKSDSVAGMYDLVTKQLYTNSGTGVFNVGDLTLPKRIQRLIFIPSKPYQQVEYLESTGEQYIDTGLSVDSHGNNEMIVSLEYTDVTASQLFGANYGGYFGVKGGTDYNVSSKTMAINTPYTYDIKRSGGKYTRILNGTSYSTGSIATRGTTSVYLFAIDGFTTLSYTKCKVKHFEYYVDNILVRNLIPVVRKIDNIPCMYDLVTKQFFLNSGTGTFIAGNPI